MESTLKTKHQLQWHRELEMGTETQSQVSETWAATGKNADVQIGLGSHGGFGGSARFSAI